MTRNEFLNGIRQETGFMLPEDRREIYAYFCGRFAGQNEEDVINELGEPKEAVKALINEFPAHKLSRPMRALVIAAAVIAAPALFDAAVVIAAIILVLLAFAALFLAALPFAGISLWMGGIDNIIRSFTASLSAADVVCRIGAGALSAGAGIFILLLVFKTYNRLIPWAARKITEASRKLTRWIKNMVRRVIL